VLAANAPGLEFIEAEQALMPLQSRSGMAARNRWIARAAIQGWG
jgi:hypothetical protein